VIVLTVAEISDLAKFAGLRIDPAQEIDRDDLETEIAVDLCPADGVTDDDGGKIKCKHIAFYDEYPEEGCYPLGTPVPPNPEISGQRAAKGQHE
jgi:hypothetical protein